MRAPGDRRAKLTNSSVPDYSAHIMRQRTGFICLFVVFLASFTCLLTSCSGLGSLIPSFNRPVISTPILQENVLITSSPQNDIRFSNFHTPTPPSGILVPTTTAIATEILPSPTSTSLPEYTSDLLFISDDDLVRWDQLTKTILPLAKNVFDYSSSKDGLRIAMLRPSQITKNGVRLFNLDILDMRTKQINSVVREIGFLSQLSISPDGRWIAYQLESDPTTIWGVEINHPVAQLELGKCLRADSGSCALSSWAPDGLSLLWQDSLGLWLTKPLKPQSALAASHDMEVLDPKGQKAQINVEYSDFTWSPQGRFGIAQIETQAGICWNAVLDTRQGTWIEIPETFDTACPTTSAIGWLDDGRIVAIQPQNAESRSGIRIVLYKLVPTGKEPLVIDQNFNISTQQMPSVAASANSKLRARWPDQTMGDFLNFGVTTTLGNDVTLFRVDLKKEELENFSTVHISPGELLWSPDSQGVLIQTEQNNPVFFNWMGKEIVEFDSAVIPPNQNFQWFPPTPR